MQSVPALEWHLYQQMYLIRRTEETLLDLFSQGLLFGTVHTCIGQEAIAVGVVNAIDKSKDVIWSNHRGHGHFLAYCDNIEGLIAEVMGKETGVCRGIGGSQHLHYNNFYTNGILGGTVACAVGSAMAEKKKNSGAITVVFLGDGAMGEGIVYESLNMASLWKLPVLFVLEHNQYAQTTPTSLAHTGDLSNRPKAFGIETREIKADNVISVNRLAQECVHKVRTQQKPLFITMHTYRFAPHSKGDDVRPAAEIETAKRSDPLTHMRWALAQINERRVASIENEVDMRIIEAVETVKQQLVLAPEMFFAGRQP
ncbi:MAG TPA: thiamine pyrophosphate-dependent dehydrogenase E1 component subunit alpha [Chloroflexi bacterium]|nr:thiamine pyrophosphate-dependent dehydrogenase E1 component subunit alpha [Chloroflexota bacterium]